MKYSPGEMIFNRDMVVHKTVLANRELIYCKRREQQVKNNKRENQAGTNYKYKIREYVHIITH